MSSVVLEELSKVGKNNPDDITMTPSGYFGLVGLQIVTESLRYILEVWGLNNAGIVGNIVN